MGQTRSVFQSRGCTIIHAHIRNHTPVYQDIPDEETCVFEMLLKSMVRYDPHERITSDRVVASEWVQKYCFPIMGDAETFVIDVLDDYLELR